MAARSARAFTLIELVVVTAIIAVLALVTVPRWGEGLTRRRLDAAAARVAADLEFARRLARAQGRAATITFDAANAAYAIDGVRDPLTLRDGYKVALGDPPYRVELRSVDFGGDAILIFDAFGASDSTGSLTLGNHAGERTLTLDSTAATPVAGGGA